MQVNNGAGAGSYVTATVAALSFIVCGFGIKGGNKDITKADTIFLIAALIATGVWLFAKQPTLSMVFLVGIDMLGFAPTVRKAWNKPNQETLFTWEINGARHALSIAAIQKYSWITILNPVVWTVANVFFSLLLISRRRKT